jgi:DNA-directed RNA polymerase specialized sigma24 family protein
MWWFASKKNLKELNEKTQEGFESVKNDMDSVGKWVKHLNKRDKQLFDAVYALKSDLSSIRDEIGSVREALDLMTESENSKQLFKKLPVLDKQTTVEDVQDVVQTAVQSDNFHGILNKLSANERLLVLTLLNNDMKLSYEDIALLLGKERSTVRGQINSIKQKMPGLIQEMSENNGKKRVFIGDDIKKKMAKYAKVRSGKVRRK